MRCEDVRDLMSEHIDGVLDAAGERQLSEHLARCDDCRQDLALLRETVSMVQDLEVVEPPADLLEKVRARIEDERARKCGVVWDFLSMTQVRVAIAACFVAVLCVYSVRELSRDTALERTMELDAEPGVAPEANRLAVGDEPGPAPEARAGHGVVAQAPGATEGADEAWGGIAGGGAKTLAYKKGKGAVVPALERPEPTAAPEADRESMKRSYAKDQPAPSAAAKKPDAVTSTPPATTHARRGSAEASGGIWRNTGRAKPKREPAAESAPLPLVAVPAEKTAELMEEVEVRAGVDADDVAIDAVVGEAKLRKAAGTPVDPIKADALNVVPAGSAARPRAVRDAGYRQASATVDLAIVTAKRAEVVKVLGDLVKTSPVAGSSDKVGAVRKNESEAPADGRKDAAVSRQDGAANVIEVRLTAAGYLDLVKRLKELGDVSIGPIGEGAGAAVPEVAADVVREEKQDVDAAGYLTVRITIVTKP